MGGDAKRMFTHIRMGRTLEFKDEVAADPEIVMRAVDGEGNTLLHMAVREGKKNIVKELLRHQDKLDPLTRNKEGLNALGATHCNTLHHTATHCNALPHTATHWEICRIPCHCNTLQHTASHCIALQDTP